MRSVDFFSLPVPSSHTMAMGFTELVTEMSTRNLPGGDKVQLAYKANNVATISQLIV
jgi:hypothetical protein